MRLPVRLRGARLWSLALWLVACEPTVTLVAPTEGQRVHGVVRLRAHVDGADGGSVVFTVDGDAVGTAKLGDGGDTEVVWWSTAIDNGSKALVARHTQGETTVSSVALTIEVANLRYGESVPTAAVKVAPDTDQHPPHLEPAFAALFEDPVSLGPPINNAGAEDSPYVSPDGNTLLLFFTPDVTVPVEGQLVDGATGIYRSHRDGEGWSTPERIYLNFFDTPALDGCATLYGEELWFCSVRAGNQREIDLYTATLTGDVFVDWRPVDARLNAEIGVGEMHLYADGHAIVFHADQASGQAGLGGADIWNTEKVDDRWQDAQAVTAVNTEYSEGWPWIDEEGTELWYTRALGAPEIWRSLNVGGVWQAPQKVIGPFAGEPSLDQEGNLYFVHHFWDSPSNSMIEADIYLCRRR